ncbi:hypothetical protein [Streptomyces mirabilis]|uniref:hypothetical protein n=1 Tax=Streptomyces mirabilis TaxID=68239 RepID=UPI0033A2870C
MSLSESEYERVMDVARANGTSGSKVLLERTVDALNGVSEQERILEAFISELRVMFQRQGMTIPLTLVECLALVHISNLKNGKEVIQNEN